MQELRRLAAVLLCASGMAYPELASAQAAAPIELKWHALEGCPSEDTVLARVRKIAGTTRATANTLRAEASVTQLSDGLFRLRLEIHYGNLAAVRNIEGKSCKDLAGAAAVALALLLSSEEPLSERDLAGSSSTTTGSSSSGASGAGDAPAGNQPSENQTSPQREPPTPPSQAKAPASPSSAESGPPRRWHVLLRAPLASLAVGPMTQMSRGLGGGVGLSFDRWRFLAEGRFWASQHETTSGTGNDYGVELNRFTVGARGCRAIWGVRFEFAPCALMSVHHLSALGSGRNLVPSTDTATWAALGIGAQSRVSITPWLGLVGTLDGELEFARPEVSVSLPPAGSPDPTPVPIERLAPFAAILSIGAEWIF